MKKICEITAEGLPAIEVTNLAEGVCPVCQAARIARKAHGAICGHGTFCRDGMYQLYLIPEDISNGRGSVEDLDLLKDCCELIIKANECELSVRTAELIKASLETHYDEWYDHLTRKRCKAMECPACYTLYIDPALCNGCGSKCLARPRRTRWSAARHDPRHQEGSAGHEDWRVCCGLPGGGHQKAGLIKPPVPRSVLWAASAQAPVLAADAAAAEADLQKPCACERKTLVFSRGMRF